MGKFDWDSLSYCSKGSIIIGSKLGYNEVLAAFFFCENFLFINVGIIAAPNASTGFKRSG